MIFQNKVVRDNNTENNAQKFEYQIACDIRYETMCTVKSCDGTVFSDNLNAAKFVVVGVFFSVHFHMFYLLFSCAETLCASCQISFLARFYKFN